VIPVAGNPAGGNSGLARALSNGLLEVVGRYKLLFLLPIIGTKAKELSKTGRETMFLTGNHVSFSCHYRYELKLKFALCLHQSPSLCPLSTGNLSKVVSLTNHKLFSDQK
jgi:hypothetical protein